VCAFGSSGEVSAAHKYGEVFLAAPFCPLADGIDRHRTVMAIEGTLPTRRQWARANRTDDSRASAKNIACHASPSAGTLQGMAQTREQVVAWSGTMVLIALAADTLIKTLNSRSPLSLLVIPILIIASPAAVVFMAAGFPLLLSFLSGLVNRKTEESLPTERIEGQRVVEALAKLGQPLSANRSRPLGYRDESNKPNTRRQAITALLAGQEGQA
jgi:hypothetical protein